MSNKHRKEITIDTNLDDLDILDPEDSQKYQEISDKLQRISLVSKSLPSYESLLGNKVGDCLSRGSFGKIKAFTPDKKKVVKESSAIFIVDNLSHKKTPEVVDQVYNLLNDVEMEPQNMFRFSELNYIFPHNFVRVYSHSRSKSLPYYQDNYIMDRIYGFDLVDYVNKSKDPFFEDTIMSLFMQGVYIIAYSNMNGYFHNDIKGNNIMVSSSEYKDVLHYKELIIGKYQILMDIFGSRKKVLKLVDYGNSKYTSKKNLIPIEIATLCTVFKSCFKDYISNDMYQVFKKFDIYTQEACDSEIITWTRNNVSLSTLEMYETISPINEKNIDVLINCFEECKQFISKSKKMMNPYVSIRIKERD